MIDSIKHLLIPLFIVISGFLCLEFTLPVALGEFLAGILGGFFIDKEHVPWIDYFSHLGLLSIMFLAGFEVDVKILKRNFKANLTIGCLSFFIPFLFTLILGYFTKYSFNASIILGICVSTTSLAIVFSVLKEANMMTSKEGQLILGSAMVVDVLSMVALALVSVEFDYTNLLFFGVLIFALLGLKKAIIFIFHRYKGNRFEFELKTIILILIALGALAEEAGLHSAIIAFIVGIMLSDVEDDHEQIIGKLSTVVFTLLAPIFFFDAGLNIELKAFSLDSFLMFLALSVISISGKYFGTYIGFYYFYAKEVKLARYAGFLFNYRLSFGIVGAMFALEKGFISTELFNIILLFVAASSIFTVYMEQKYSRKHKYLVEG